MISSFEVKPMLVSGASEAPRYMFQRRRARRAQISDKKRRALAATAGGGLLARTCSKERRARLSVPLRKNTRASSRRTRSSPGRSNQHAAEGGDGLVQQRIPLRLRNIRLLRCPDRRQADEENHVRLDRPAPAQRPQHGQGLVEPGPSRINVRASAMPVSADWLEVPEMAALARRSTQGEEERTAAAAARTRRRGLMVIIEVHPDLFGVPRYGVCAPLTS